MGKATQDVDSPFDGIIKELLLKEGDIAKCKVGATGVGDLIVRIDDGIDDGNDTKEEEAKPQMSDAGKQKEKEIVTQKQESNTTDESQPKKNKLSSPAVKRLLKVNNLDAAMITATGPKGLLTKGDVLG